MFAFLKNIRRRRRMKALEVSHIRVFPNVEELGRVALVWRMENQEEVAQLDAVLDFFKSAKLEATVVIVEHGKIFRSKAAREEFFLLCDDKGVIFIPKDEVKWYGFPKGEVVKQLFHEPQYDMCVCICGSSDFTVEYLASGIKSNFTAGMFEPQWCNFSFILKKGSFLPTAQEYLVALFEYMRKMNQE